MDTSELLKSVQNHTGFIKRVVMVFGPIAMAVGGFFWYMNNIWHPKVTVLDVDYEKGIATLDINGHTRVLYSGSTVSASYGWGVRFAASKDQDYDRLELVKNDLTFKTISAKDKT